MTHWYEWLIVLLPLSLVFYLAWYTRRFVRGVSDFLAAGRICGRYMLAVGGMEAGLSVITLVALVEANYRTGFSTGFWSAIVAPITLLLSLTGFCSFRLRETKALSCGQFLEMRYNRGFRLFCAFVRSTAELLANCICPAISARFFIYFLGLPLHIKVFGFQIPTFAIVIAIVLTLAATILLLGGTLSLVVTDTLQGLMTYPIIFIFTMFIVFNYSWWDEIVPVMTDRVKGESFLNPYDIEALRDFNLFAVFVGVFSGILNRANWFGGGASSAARTAHEQKMSGVLGAWRSGFNPLFYLLLAGLIITVMNHKHFAPQAKVIRTEMCTRIAEEIIHDDAMRQALNANINAIPEQVHEIGVDTPLSEKQNLDTPYLNTALATINADDTPANKAKYQEFRTLYNQLRLPIALKHIMPPALLALFCLLALMLMISSDDSYMFSSAMSLVQDIVIPLRQKPLTPEAQIKLIKLFTILVCITFFCGSLFMTQMDYIRLYTQIVVAIWSGGAGPVMLGGLYTRFGTVAGAYASIASGVIISGGGFLVNRNWAKVVYPFLDRHGLVEPLGRLMKAISSPLDPYVRWEMNPIKFPINSYELFFIAMVSSIVLYVVVSLLTCREPFNLDRMLHRGKYSVDGEKKTFEKVTIKTVWKKLIGITPDYTRGDKIIAYGTFIWSFGIVFGVFFLGTVIWNTFQRWPIQGWAWRLFTITLLIGGLNACVSMVWFLIGGIRDMRRMFKDLAARVHFNDLDNGMVSGNLSLADKADLEKVDEADEKPAEEYSEEPPKEK